ncbi:MAG: TRAP transporter large permease subunit [Desulfatiglandaceae bacterium]|jgi:tripartite ATP-independent transporter DctM subunit
MSVELITVLLFGGMMALMFLGVPALFAIGGISAGLALWLEGYTALFTLASTAFAQVTSMGLLAIPMFVMMANLLIFSGIADRLFQTLSYWFTRIRGSLAVASVAVSTALAMCGGFGPGIITMSMVAIPAMRKRNYDKSLAIGSVMAGGILGPIIPPSVMMIVMAYITRLPVGKLFMAGIIPGFIASFGFVIYILVKCYLNPELAPPLVEEVTWKMRWISLGGIILPVFLVVGMLVAIFGGIATPTEAAGVGAAGALLCCVLNRTISWAMIKDSCLETIKVTGMVIWLMIAANFLRVFFTSVGARSLVINLVTGMHVGPWVILIGMQIMLLVLGMFMDDWAIIVICAPIFFPIALKLGFNPIWFAMVFLLNMVIAYLTPPFGWALILTKALSPPDVSTSDVWRSAPPYMAILVLVMILVMVFPSLALWLPSLVY